MINSLLVHYVKGLYHNTFIAFYLFANE